MPWSTVYQHPNSWACLNPATCNVPVQPAAGYELLTNLVVLALLLFLVPRVTRPGILLLVYLYCYAITQFLLFFERDNTIVSFLGLNWGLKQAQWTSLVLLVVLLPITYLILRYSRPVPEGEVAATYGIPQKPQEPLVPKTLDGQVVEVNENGKPEIVEANEDDTTEAIEANKDNKSEIIET